MLEYEFSFILVKRIYFSGEKNFKNLLVKVISVRLNKLKILYIVKLIFYCLHKSFLNEGCSSYPLSNIKKTNLLK